MHYISLSAPGLVQSLRVGSVDVTNITIQWDRVNCVDRNGRTDSYFILFYPTSNPSNRDAQTVFGTGDNDRMFSLTGLPPRTNYTFEVDANNPRIRDPGAVATVTASTTAPLGELNYQKCQYIQYTVYMEISLGEKLIFANFSFAKILSRFCPVHTGHDDLYRIGEKVSTIMKFIG